MVKMLKPTVAAVILLAFAIACDARGGLAIRETQQRHAGHREC